MGFPRSSGESTPFRIHCEWRILYVVTKVDRPSVPGKERESQWDGVEAQ